MAAIAPRRSFLKSSNSRTIASTNKSTRHSICSIGSVTLACDRAGRVVLERESDAPMCTASCPRCLSAALSLRRACATNQPEHLRPEIACESSLVSERCPWLPTESRCQISASPVSCWLLVITSNPRQFERFVATNIVERFLGAPPDSIRDDSDLVRQVMALANREADLGSLRSYYRSVMRTEALSSTPRPIGGRKRAETDDIKQMVDPKPSASSITNTQPDHFVQRDIQFARDLLACACLGRTELEAFLRGQARSAELTSVVISRTRVIFSANGGATIERVPDIEPLVFYGCAAVLTHAAIVLLSNDAACRTNLGRCRLAECGRFFTIERGKTGRPRTDYCSQDHMLRAHASAAAERQRRSQANRRKTNKRGAARGAK
jgi:hypothetical protein